MEKEQLQELIENNKEDIFSEIKDEISDDTVTDIEWDGYNLWITQLGRGLTECTRYWRLILNL